MKCKHGIKDCKNDGKEEICGACNIKDFMGAPEYEPEKENANSGYPLLGDSYERYELIRDYEDPCGTINKGVIKTEYQWMARFALLNPGDCKIKKDWFKAVESE